MGRFHVDKMSSAHVYCRLNKNQTIESLSEELLEDCAQLVKANSIQGETYHLLHLFLGGTCQVYTPVVQMSRQRKSCDIAVVALGLLLLVECHSILEEEEKLMVCDFELY
jgi:hypothetical protein